MRELTEKRLLEAGWRPDRKIDIKAIEDFYISRGFTMVPCVRAFIEEFGMLSFNIPRQNKLNSRRDSIHFNPYRCLGERMTQSYFEGIYDEFPTVLDIRNIDFYPIGETDSGNMFFLMGSNGKFFSYTDCCLVKYGDDKESMLDCLIGRYFKPVIFD